MITPEELARLKAIAHGSSDSAFDTEFWTSPKTVQALIAEVERYHALARAVIDEEYTSMGHEGPSWGLAQLAEQAFKASDTRDG